ncbi:pentatricopeptide repeat-containing protein At1g06143-like [Zingiber officinale]|uniref:Chlororespiratory reduction 4 n=1 Tax=Zingiber officinale TaxID=94328 RepID=A0A8J5FP68_ZINOF|nr:pentatricopeptide repeat-containing protein At1g06143-like [Zingiber officinale]XP_042418704.1 pentatricopeptide repeat-containing protein At1g06143-like [Zingiber officinale]XP_042418705.1 pentatricopeptide repeat-containing protein At1g06143-like [Zingiber officinale]XP_042418706.1 pentatricopeptide repeat-containing protein At1g06143-like [Zingiber officinale]XP_042418707.1 pentatricopeptide repeat-containing protein At1g06143-like [Zingiber officinale]KAG6491108.1 hypothetical protein Z
MSGNGSAILFSSLLRCCRSLEVLKSVHATMIKSNAHQDSFFVNQFVSQCSRIRQVGYALQVSAQMAEPNVFVYNAVFGGLVQEFASRECVELYVGMLRSNVLPDGYTFSYLVKACAQLSAVELGAAVHAQIEKLGFGRQILVRTVLMDFYSSIGWIGEARKLFDEMSDRDVVSWTAMIHSHSCVGDMISARRLFDEMPERSVVSWNTMIAGYGRSGDVETANSLFNEMPEKNLVSWTTMISCYSQNKRYKEAIECFERMKAAGVSPDEVTMTTAISACAHLGALNVGRELHLYSMSNKLNFSVHLGSALVDMYAKCGCLEKALITFYKLEEKNTFCWNCIIEGLAIHGYGSDAITMFRKMNEEGKARPNFVTFVSVLSACNHSGMIEEGRRLFSSMIKDYSICPVMEHYGCMVDLLSRGGHLEEALNLMSTMPMKPNAVMWLALLSGCRIHRNMELTEISAEKLLSLEPNNSSHYMLLINIYSEGKAWEKVERVREMMKEKEVQKRTPGCSWIDINGVVREFAAGHMFQLSSEMYFLLLRLDRQLKLVGFSPE